MAANNDMGDRETDTLTTVIERLKNHWVTIPPDIQESFLGQTEELMKIDHALRSDDGLADYDIETYPELVSVLRLDQTSAKPGDVRSTIHLISSQVQLMENVFLGLRLAEYYAHPLNRGWMNLFRRWAATPTFRRCWPIICGTFSRAFVEFAECHLYVPQSSCLTYLQQPLTDASIQTVQNQLVNEWPRGEQIPKDFVSALQTPYQVPTASDQLVPGVWSAWIMHEPDVKDAHDSPSGELLGVVALAPRKDDPRESAKSKRCDTIRLSIYGWIRAGYRDLGIRHQLYGLALETIRSTLKLKPHYSIEVTADLGEDIEVHVRTQHPKAEWMSFHEQVGFVRVSRNLASRQLLYRRTITPPNS